MLTLYYRPSCLACKKVVRVAKQLGLQLSLVDINADWRAADELIARGGRWQVPYLVDGIQQTEMYESENIVTHLKTNYVR